MTLWRVKVHSGFFIFLFLNTNGEPTNTASNVTNSSSYELIFRHVFMSHICPNLFPCGPLHGDLLNHLQLRMTLIPISSPHLIHLSRALHCLSLAFKWQWYIRHITETKGRQGLSFYSALNQKKKVTKPYTLVALHKKFTRSGNFIGPLFNSSIQRLSRLRCVQGSH